MTDDKKLLTVQGNVQTVYAPQTVAGKWGAREKVDVVLQTPKGGKVRVTFWNQAVDKGIEGGDISVTNLKYGGVYKDTHQFSSTKESKIHLMNTTARPVEQTVAEIDPTDPPATEPAVSEPEVDVEQEIPVEAPKKRGRPAKVVEATAEVATDPIPVSAKNAQVEHPSEALVLSNLQAAERIAKTLGYDRIGMVELITLGDMIGRTAVALRIEAGKDQRMANYKK